jgi:hypothetical protein
MPIQMPQIVKEFYREFDKVRSVSEKDIWKGKDLAPIMATPEGLELQAFSGRERSGSPLPKS